MISPSTHLQPGQLARAVETAERKHEDEVLDRIAADIIDVALADIHAAQSKLMKAIGSDSVTKLIERWKEEDES